MNTLTDAKIVETLRAIDSETKRLGVPPTRAEIANVLGLADHTVAARRVEKLQRRGLVVFEFGVSRSIRITREGAALLAVSQNARSDRFSN
jgi:repressor LexA